MMMMMMMMMIYIYIYDLLANNLKVTLFLNELEVICLHTVK